MTEVPLYNRVLLKLSGEGLMGNQDFGLDQLTMEKMAQDIKTVIDIGVEVCLVIGGGNIFRGVAGVTAGLERTGSHGHACDSDQCAGCPIRSRRSGVQPSSLRHSYDHGLQPYSPPSNSTHGKGGSFSPLAPATLFHD